jgi:hypothetical protein
MNYLDDGREAAPPCSDEERRMAEWICYEFHDCLVMMFDGSSPEDVYRWAINDDHNRAREQSIIPTAEACHRMLRHAALITGFFVEGDPFPPKL